MTGLVRIDLIRLPRPAGWFSGVFARWLLTVAARHHGVDLVPGAEPGAVPGAVPAASGAEARVLVVRDDGRVPDAAVRLATRGDDDPVPVALVAYGGAARGRPALDRARAVLESAGVPVAAASFGVNAAEVRERGFDDADRLLWSAVLDSLCAALVSD